MSEKLQKRVYFSIKQAAEYLEIGEPTLYRWMRDRKITYRKIGDSTRFTQADLDAVEEVFYSRRDTSEVRKRCPVCGGNRLENGRLRSTGLLHFELKKSKFWTLSDSSIKSSGMICADCGAITLFGDCEKLAKLTAELPAAQE